MRYYVIAGEASGDLHAANLVRALARRDPAAVFRGWGGDRMAAEGVELVRHYRDLAFMGFVEVAANLRAILRNLAFCKRDLAAWKPDAVVLVDYPGFNLRMARFAHAIGLRVFYYISPQVWAWNVSRIRHIRASVERLFVILPFEQAFYARHGYDVTYVGHPLLEVIAPAARGAKDRESFVRAHGLSGKPIVALLPGSRRQEIRNMLPVMLRAAGDFPDHEFVVGGAPSLAAADYEPYFLAGRPPRIVFGGGHDLLRAADAAVVTSGTATLEAALLETPEVVCYKGNYFSYLLARRMVKVPHISLVNLILGEPLVRELIQADLTPAQITAELKKLLFDAPAREAMVARMRTLRGMLGGEDRPASEKTAEGILAALAGPPLSAARGG
jgi:lipid-A-disaccharide synthase